MKVIEHTFVNINSKKARIRKRMDEKVVAFREWAKNKEIYPKKGEYIGFLRTVPFAGKGKL